MEAARQDLDAARARGGEEALDKAVLELSGAEDERRELAESLGTGRVHAPVSGAVLAPSRSGANVLAAGRSVEEGEALLRIGDFSRMTAIATVDEVDVVRIAGRPGRRRLLRLSARLSGVPSRSHRRPAC